eukprot:COSAG01_NODE_1594_length_9789_cov_98.477399_7_plen_52_part_00
MRNLVWSEREALMVATEMWMSASAFGGADSKSVSAASSCWSILSLRLSPMT